MADGITMTLEGSKQLEAKMRLLEKKVSVKISKDAVRKSSKVILVQAKANASGRVGGNMGRLIARSLQLKVAKSKFRDQFRIRVQHNPKFWQEFVGYSQGSSFALSTRSGKGKVIPGKQVSGKRYYIPSAIEYGHIKRGGSGFVAAMPYMRPAFDSRRATAARTMERELFSGIERAWRVS